MTEYKLTEVVQWDDYLGNESRLDSGEFVFEWTENTYDVPPDPIFVYEQPVYQMQSAGSFTNDLHYQGSVQFTGWIWETRDEYNFYNTVKGSSGNDTITGLDDTSYAVHWMNDGYGGKADYGYRIDIDTSGVSGDTLYGLGGNDVINGRGGDDTIYGDNSANPNQGSGNDKLYGGSGADKLYGGGGRDTLIGGAGKDEIYGGAGNDLIYLDLPDSDALDGDYVEGGAGADTFFIGGTTTTSTTTTTGGFDWGGFTFDLFSEVVSGGLDLLGVGTVASTFASATLGTISSALDTEAKTTTTVENTPGNLKNGGYIQIKDFDFTEDVLVIPIVSTSQSAASNVKSVVSDGELRLYYANTGQTFATIELDDLNTIYNTNYSSTDTAINDAILESVVSNALVVDSNKDLVGLGLGTFDDNTLTDVETDDGVTVEDYDASYIVLGAYAGKSASLAAGNPYLTGTDYSDFLFAYSKDLSGAGSSPSDSYEGDQIFGFDGNDILAGGGGSDSLYGGAGFDFASFQDEKDPGNSLAQDNLADELTGVPGVVVDLSAVQNAANFDGSPAYVEDTDTDAKFVTATDAYGYTDYLFGIEGVLGSQSADRITGSDEANYLAGNAGNDALSGGGGNDTLSGGAGNDSIVGGSGNDVASYGLDVLLGGFEMAASATQGVDYTMTSDSGTDSLTGVETVRFSNESYNVDIAVGSANKVYKAANNNGSYSGISGSDLYIFSNTYNNLGNGLTKIQNFETEVDKILIDASAFGISNSADISDPTSWVGTSNFSSSQLNLTVNGKHAGYVTGSIDVAADVVLY